MKNPFCYLVISLFSVKCMYADDVGPDFDATNVDDYELNYGFYPFQTYQSSELTSPALRKALDTPECYDDLYTFITPRGYSIRDPGPMILDNSGELIWAKKTDGQAYDLTVQEFKGEKYLTYWLGDDRIRGHGQGDYYMLNSSYRQVHKISALNGLKADLHEFLITPEGTALVTIYEVYEHDLTQLRNFSTAEYEQGQANYIWDSLFQEIDIEKNELIFQWRASDHHAVVETNRDLRGTGTKDNAFDYFHINSVQKDEHGNYLVSARYTHTLTYINGSTGETIWVLGGDRNMFQDLSEGQATNFGFQHDARFHSLHAFPELLADEIREWGPSKEKDGFTRQLISLFDNAKEDDLAVNDHSRGLLLEVTYPSVDPSRDSVDHDHSGDLSKRTARDGTDSRYTVRLVRAYDHPDRVLSSSQGSFQVVHPPSTNPSTTDPKILLGYGFNAVFAEFSSNGDVICDSRFAASSSWGRGDVQSYRAFKHPWVGNPIDPPAAVLGDDAVWVSWNGATEVVEWVLQHSASYEPEMQSWQTVAVAPKTGFESLVEFEEDNVERYLRVQALDINGRILGVSRPIDLGWTAGLTSAIKPLNLPGLAGDSISPLKMVILFAVNVSALFVLWALWRKVWAWRRSRAWTWAKRQRTEAAGLMREFRGDAAWV